MAKSANEAFRQNMVNTLERRMFYVPSFKIYGGVAGLYDFGPPGCAIKQNITQYWRQHFVLEEGMLEVECPAVTPEIVLRASGHVERFTDFMVTDMKTGDPHRADHLLEAHLEAVIADKKTTPEKVQEAKEVLARVGELSLEALGQAIKEYGIKAPDTKNDLSEPFPFNLMFKTSIGPKGDLVGYMRPETAQGIFVNFRDLLYYNGNKLPFACAQIGQSYRNEISPRAGLLRVREFTQAEIEHFVNPDDKSHPKFAAIADLDPLLYSQALQNAPEKIAKRMTLREAVEKGIMNNETLAYFIGRTYLFMKQIGINLDRVRFRQHLQSEMAHYSQDCWDCEIECSYGWVECVGLADRSAYDLKAHTAMSKQELSAFERFPETKTVKVLVAVPNKKELGVKFKKEAKAVTDAIAGLGEEDVKCLQDELAGSETAKVGIYEITRGMVDIKMEEQKKTGRTFTPNVIEPSFGIGRIIYCMLEHCYDRRPEDEQKTLFHFTPVVAPVKVTVFPLLQRPELNSVAERVSAALTAARMSNIVDVTGTAIGKRYARTDEIGVPFACTVDMQTLEDEQVTVRDRDSREQVRVPISRVPDILRRLSDMVLTWAEVQQEFPPQAAPAE